MLYTLILDHFWQYHVGVIMVNAATGLVSFIRQMVFQPLDSVCKASVSLLLTVKSTYGDPGAISGRTSEIYTRLRPY